MGFQAIYDKLLRRITMSAFVVYSLELDGQVCTVRLWLSWTVRMGKNLLLTLRGINLNSESNPSNIVSLRFG